MVRGRRFHSHCTTAGLAELYGMALPKSARAVLDYWDHRGTLYSCIDWRCPRPFLSR